MVISNTMVAPEEKRPSGFAVEPVLFKVFINHRSYTEVSIVIDSES